MKELIEIQSRLNVPKCQYNRFGKYKFRSCEDILAAVKPLLKEVRCTLTISDDVIMIGSRIYIKATAVLTNSSNEVVMTTAFAREEEQRKGMDGSQVTGTASSYARKYALNGLFAIDDTKDADSLNDSPQYTQPKEQEQHLPTPADEDGNSLIDIYNVYAKPAIEQAQTKEDLTRIYNDYKALQPLKEFVSGLTARRKALGI